jgi:hypothetical protein
MPTQTAEFMEAKPSPTQSRLSCGVHGGKAVSDVLAVEVILRSSWRRSRLPRNRGYPAEFMEAAWV